MKKYFISLVLFTTLILTSCLGVGENSDTLPPERPAGTISGRVVDGTIIDSQINIYRFENGIIRELLGSTTSNNEGRYTLELRQKNQPVLIEATGGSYIEEASGTRVTLQPGQRLRSIVYYDSSKLNVNITPLTHLAAALTEQKISQGTSAEDAIDAAVADISTLFNIDIINTNPLDITDPGHTASTLNDGHLYGIYLAALSSFTQWASEKNANQTHTTYTSIGLAQTLYADILADGRLDGKGITSQGDPVDLGMGTVALNENNLRVAFAQHMLAIVNNEANQTTITTDDVLPSAQRLANSRHALFGGNPPVVTDDSTPALFTIEPSNNINSNMFSFGTLYFSVNINGPLNAASVEFDIDGSVISAEIDVKNPILEIDVSQYADGDHSIGVRVTDLLGVELYRQFNINFKNISPLINVTSSAVTNLDNFTVSGLFDNSNTAITSIMIKEQSATLSEDGSWTVPAALDIGPNILTLLVKDDIGTLYQTQTRIDLDKTPPAIDTSAGHSLARFSLGKDQTEMRPLTNSNLLTPLFQESDKLELAGTVITRGALDAAGIPYFAFKASDPDQQGIFTTTEAIRARFLYKKNDQVFTPWQELTLVGQEFLLPLASETLNPAWHQTTFSDEHFIQVEVIDQAGNKTEAMFSFKIDIHVPVFSIETMRVLNTDLFVNTPFANRSNLHSLEFASTTYTFNSSAQTMYLNVVDQVIHNAEQGVDELVREHDARLKTETQWRVGLVGTPLTECPNMSTWQIVSQIFNYTSSGWNLEQTPVPVFDNPVSVNADMPTPPEPLTWIDTSDFDAVYAPFGPLPIGASSWQFNYDYVLQIPDPVNSPIPSAAFISNWKRTDTNNAELVVNCDPVRFFQQRDFYSYESVRGPENLASSFTEMQSFNTTGFELIDHGPGVCPIDVLPPGNLIMPVGSWHRIPAGRCITIKKLVTTPALNLYDDIAVATPSTFTSYIPQRYDKTISWYVDPSLIITAIHDAGESNISQMSTKEILAGDGEGNISVYQISR